MTTKDRLHELVNGLPESSTDAAENFLQYLTDTADPVLRALWTAPLTDEALSESELAEIEAAWEDFRKGNTVSLQDIKKKLDNRD